MEKDINTYANFGQRLLAFLIDFLALFIASSIVWLIFQLPIPDRHTHLFNPIVLFMNPFGSLFSWLYYAIMESSKHQGTLGKMALGIRVGNINGERISFLNATGRFFGKFISSLLLGFGYFMILFSKNRQALHDVMASTYLIKVGFSKNYNVIDENESVEYVEQLAQPPHVQEQTPLTQQVIPDFDYERKVLSDSYSHKLLTENEYEIKLGEINMRELELNAKAELETQQQYRQDFDCFFNHELNKKAEPLISKLKELRNLNLLSEDEFIHKSEMVYAECKTALDYEITFEGYMQLKSVSKSKQISQHPQDGEVSEIGKNITIVLIVIFVLIGLLALLSGVLNPVK